MKSLVPLFTFLLIYLSSSAQFENIDLSEYRLPEIERHQLDLRFQYNSDFFNGSYQDVAEFASFDLDNNLNADYSYFFNSEKIQMEGWTRFLSDINLNWEKVGDGNFEKHDSYNHRLDVGFSKRNYFNADDHWFFYWSPVMIVQYSPRFTKQPSGYDVTYSDKTFYRDFDIRPELSVGGGIGRIEPVGDLRSALYILEDLYKKERLERLPNEPEILQLAHKISQLRNKRFFDSRLRRIYEIKSLDSLMSQMGIVNDADAIYFTSINDIWSYSEEARFTGSRIQIDFFGGLRYRFNKTKFELYNFSLDKWTTSENHNYYDELVGGQVLADFYKPIGLKWQRYFGFNFSIRHRFADPSVPTPDYNTLNGNITYRYDWYFNTRTSASFGIQANYNGFDYSENENNIDDLNEISGSFNGALSYYFSPRLKASAQIGLYYGWNDNLSTDYNNQFRLRSRVEIRYAIF